MHKFSRVCGEQATSCNQTQKWPVRAPGEGLVPVYFGIYLEIIAGEEKAQGTVAPGLYFQRISSDGALGSIFIC